MKFRKALEKPAPSFVCAEYETRVELLRLDNGLRTLTRNFRCKLEEIDLIMGDGDIVVFVEVLYRSNARFGGPFASFTLTKQKRLIKTATQYLANSPKLVNRDCRFDAVDVTRRNGALAFDRVIGAFSA